MYQSAPAYKPKVEGEVCNDCGKGRYVKNPKTGKIFCDQKCWLTTQEKQVDQVKQATSDKVRTENINWLNARTSAVQIVISQYNNKDIQMSEIEEAIDTWTGKIALISQPPF
jgi:hypothetical protein